MTDPFPNFPTLNQTQLGVMFAVSPHLMGRWLKEVGLRRPDGQPVQKAVDAGIAVRVSLDDGTHPFWVWAKQPTIRILEAAGHQRVDASASQQAPVAPLATPVVEVCTKLTGPFIPRRSDTEGDGFEIADINGVVAIWCRGEWLADVLVKLLNLCFKTKKWFC